MGIRKGLGRNSSALMQDQIKLQGPWKREESSTLNYTFRGDEPGPSIPVDSSTAMELFPRFFTDEVWELITTETNRYAARLRNRVITPLLVPGMMSL